jgi:type VI secretion system secreted protein VgrG
MAKDYVDVRFESDSVPDAHIQIHKLRGREAISQLFAIEVQIVCTNPEKLSTTELTGAKASLIFEKKGVEIRRLHGMVAEIDDMLNVEDAHRTYKLLFVPRAFRLTLVETQEIFLDTSVQSVIQEKLERCQLGQAVEWRFQGKQYPEREFIAQYKESDLAFVSRLAEHLGISYFFDHEGGEDKIIFTDNASGFPLIQGGPFPFRPKGETCDVYRLEQKTRVIPKAHVIQDYNYRTPVIDLTFSEDAPSGFDGGVVEYGTHHKDEKDGPALAKVRAEEREATHRVYTGESDLCQLSAGMRLKIEGHSYLGDLDLLLIEVEHRASQIVVGQGGDATEQAYSNRWKAIDASLTYRPPRITPKPRIFGVVNGIIEHDPVSEPGMYAQLDPEGRYSVRFLFDMADHSGGKVSRPVRMAQPHAGPGYGHHFPLKPGIEVLIAFIDGDPDRPIIVGAVPNPVTPSPVDRHNALLSRIKTTTGIVIEMKDI